MKHPRIFCLTLPTLVLALLIPLEPTSVLAESAPSTSSWWPFSKDTKTKNSEITVNQEPIKRDVSFTTSFSAIVKKAAPSVVNIKTSTAVKASNRSNSPLNDPLFRRFFGDQLPGVEEEESPNPPPRPNSRKTIGLGSGVIFSKDGYIVTNNHVINEADEILIDIPSQNHKEYKATIVGTDSRSDLAILKIEGNDLPSMVIGDSDKIEVGDVVLAIGNPFGLGQTVTQGIVSALGRNLKLSREAYEDFIQTDASINQGNSGGALVDAEGRLVGINTAIISPTGGNLGIGFAVPVNMVRSVMEQIIKSGKVSRGYLGVIIEPLDSDLAASFGLKSNAGALVNQVADDGGAKQAGIKRGDVITELNGKPVESPDELRLKVSREKPGDKIKLKVMREGKAKEFEITLAELSDKSQTAELTPGKEEESAQSGEFLAGLRIEELTPALRKKINIPDNIKGVVISEVDPAESAAEAGIRPGSVLVEIGPKEIKSVQEAQDAIKGAKGKIRLLLWEQGFFRYKILSK
jgi:serine protease Do